MRNILTFAALFTVPAVAYVGQWHSYTSKSHVNALVEHQGQVFAGTTGGIRRIDPVSMGEINYDNRDGLTDPWVESFVKGADGSLWAVARSGFLYNFKGNRWETWGRSYASLGWSMNGRAALASGSIFFLGSEKGLSIFDANQKVAQLNITRFQSETEISVYSFLRRGDTLYTGTDRGIYKAPVYFADPVNPPVGSTFPNLADPNAWIKASSAIGHTLRVVGDSVVAGPKGTLIEGPIRVEAFSDSILKIGTQNYTNDWRGYKTALAVGDRIFLGGSPALLVSDDPTGSTPDARPIQPLNAYPQDTIYNIAAHGGQVWGYAVSGVYKLTGRNDFPRLPVTLLGTDALTSRNLRVVKAAGDGTLYVGSWGWGLTRIRPNETRTWNNTTDTCMHQAFPPNDPFTVVQAVGNPRNGGIYFAVVRAQQVGNHQLVYLDTSTSQITCFENLREVPGNEPHAIEAFSDTLLGVATTSGVGLFKTRRSISGLPQLEFRGTWTVRGGATEAWDLATDAWGRPWALTGGTLASLDFDSLEIAEEYYLDAVTGFDGENCLSLEADAKGLWVGCSNGLYNLASDPTGSLSLIRRYGMDDGLLSLKILDVTVDPVTGKVWIATDRGVNMVEGAGPGPVAPETLSPILPYPNPFRPQHAFVIFNNLPEKSTLRIHEPSGKVIRTFLDRERVGNEFQWNGKNEQGKAVAPGVYLYSVVSGSKVQRGKVIVAR